MPDNEALYDEAIKLKDDGNLEQAIAKMQALVEQDESYALAHSALAKMLTDTGNHPDAIKHALKVTELEPNDPFSFTALSVTYQRGGFIPEAEDAMAKARTVGQ